MEGQIDNQNVALSKSISLTSPCTSRCRSVSILALATLLCSLPASAQDRAGSAPDSSASVVTTVRVDATPGHETNSFIPNRALGSSIDVLPEGDVDKAYTDQILNESLSAGWGPITYRNNAELRMAAWHWNHDGTWSDADQQAGYFIGKAEPGEMLRHSYYFEGR